MTAKCGSNINWQRVYSVSSPCYHASLHSNVTALVFCIAVIAMAVYNAFVLMFLQLLSQCYLRGCCRNTYNYTSGTVVVNCCRCDNTYQTLRCRFEGLGREAVQAEQPGFVIGGTGTETIYQQTKWRTWLFSIWLSFDIVCFA